MISDRSADDPATGAFLDAVRALIVAATARGEDAGGVREEALAAVAAWTETADAQGDTPDVGHLLRGVSGADREVLGEALREISAWVRAPGEENGRRVDAVIARMRRELGPLLVGDRAAEESAERERLRADVRASIAARLRESGAVRGDRGDAGDGGDGETGA